MKQYCYHFPISQGEHSRQSGRARLLTKYWHEAARAEREAQKYAVGYGADEYWSDPNFFAGGVSYLSFKKEPDSDVWRKATKIDGMDAWEPNVRMVQMMARVAHGLQPSDTWNTVYQHKARTFDEVRERYSLEQWAQLCKVVLSGNDDKDWRRIANKLRHDDFVDFVRIMPMTDVRQDNRGRLKPTRKQSRAVRAQKLRLRLPVVRVEELYSILGADVTAKDERGHQIRAEHTPTFFKYWGEFYFCCDFPCKGDDLKELPFGEYMANMRQAERQAERQRTS